MTYVQKVYGRFNHGQCANTDRREAVESYSGKFNFCAVVRRTFDEWKIRKKMSIFRSGCRQSLRLLWPTQIESSIGGAHRSDCTVRLISRDCGKCRNSRAVLDVTEAAIAEFDGVIESFRTTY